MLNQNIVCLCLSAESKVNNAAGDDIACDEKQEDNGGRGSSDGQEGILIKPGLKLFRSHFITLFI